MIRMPFIVFVRANHHLCPSVLAALARWKRSCRIRSTNTIYLLIDYIVDQTLVFFGGVYLHLFQECLVFAE
jgi:hypothetical protein